MRIGWKGCMAAAPLLVTLASPAMAIPVDQFIARADALKAKGFTALFSPDLKRLRDQAISDFAQLRSERLAAKSAGGQPPSAHPQAASS
jgi:hypothetical protein